MSLVELLAVIVVSGWVVIVAAAIAMCWAAARADHPADDIVPVTPLARPEPPLAPVRRLPAL